MKRRLALITAAAALVLPACGASDSADEPFNGADAMFAQMMIPHHEQAIEMADMALDPAMGTGQAITTLATRIKAAQDPEIEQMKALLKEWGQPETPDSDMDHSSMMSGMMSTEELDALGNMMGSEFDAAWARAMIAHHEGAIQMANDVLANGKNAEIRSLAEAIISGQTAEISTLKPLADS